MTYPSRALISRSAFANNLGEVRSVTADAAIAAGRPAPGVMAIVKADAYGHGRDIVARWAVEEGADYLGVAQVTEAVELRETIGPEPRIFSWIYSPGTVAPALAADIEISVGAAWALEEVAEAARAAGITARVHLKVNTGMARGGLELRELPEVARRAARLEADGAIVVVGLWSHLARADEPTCGETERQISLFEGARHEVRAAGLKVEVHHLAASSGILWHPAAHYDLVRPGIVLYGLSPEPAVATARELGLRAVMQLEADLIVERDVPAGTGVSYGHTERVDDDAHLAVVPLGYGDGIPRAASGLGPVMAGGVLGRVIGRVCMDQFVTATPAHTGDTAVLFGDAAAGLPTADDWAQLTGTIGYEIVTRIGTRVPRIPVD